MITDEAAARAWLLQLPQADAVALERLQRLVTLLVEENTRQNLVSTASLDDVWRRHIVDSAQLLCLADSVSPGTWLDLGTGAGFPGLAIACLLPDTEVLMVESRARRIEWLARAAESLGLGRAKVCGSRLELVPDQKVGTISARAFAPLDKLLELSARFSTPDTVWLLPKGRSARQELDELSGWQHMFHVEQSLTDNDAGIIVGKLIGRSKTKGRKA